MERLNAIATMAATAVLGGGLNALASPNDRAPWERAMAAHRSARKDLEADDYTDRYDALSEAYGCATDGMMQTPAPDGPALLYKLEYLFGEEACGGDSCSPAYQADWVNAFMRDAYSLLFEGRA